MLSAGQALRGCVPLPIIHWRSRFLVASPTARDLLLRAKHLFVAARTVWHGLQSSCGEGGARPTRRGLLHRPEDAGGRGRRSVQDQRVPLAYDYIVASPPFSDKTWSTGLIPAADPFQRFAWGEPPKKQGDYAYLLHIIRSTKSTGKAACILPHGVLFRGNVEADIRQKLVRSGYLKGIIGLPANLFYATGIPACILVIDKENAIARKGIFMIDASKDFMKDGNKNRLARRAAYLVTLG